MTEEIEYVIGIDFEAAGGNPRINAFTQVGAVILNMKTGEIVDTFNAYSSMEGFEWDKRCVTEFWEKNPELYEKTKTETSQALSPYSVIQKLLTWIKNQNIDLKATYFISDNVAFDIALLKCFCLT